MTNGSLILVLFSLVLPILLVYAIVSIAIDARAIRRLLEHQDTSRPSVGSGQAR